MIFGILIGALAWVSLANLWLLFLAGMGLWLHRKSMSLDVESPTRSKIGPAQTDELASTDLPRIAVIIPAHNEEAGIGASVHAAQSTEYPRNKLHVVVVADNCSDSTGAAAAQAGAEVLQRDNIAQNGKGYALRFAFDTLLFPTSQEPTEKVDAIVVMDADSTPSRGLLSSFASQLAKGDAAIQAEDGVSNPNDSPLTWLLHVGNCMENVLFYQAREKLGLPSVLRGNGMCFSASLLRQHPWASFSITEDMEYSMQLLLSGVYVRYLPSEWVRAASPTTYQQLRMQRLRWAAGNAGISRSTALRCLGEGVRRRRIDLIETGWSHLISSRPLLLLNILVPILGGLVLGNQLLVNWGLALLAAQALLFIAGLAVAGFSLRKFLWLFTLPVLLGQLMVTTVLGVFGVGRSAWVRTKRD